MYTQKYPPTHTHTHSQANKTHTHACARTHTHTVWASISIAFIHTTRHPFLSNLWTNCSACFSYIERFRHGAPMSREERLRLEGNKKSEFWWLQSSPPTPNSTSTPKEGEGRSLPLTSQGRGGLTVENLRKRDDLDNATDQLQQKAERLLER